MNNSQAWIKVGYDLFSHEGHEGLQVERIARILNLNKSGFYHYFGEINTYLKHLIQHHHRMVDLLIKDIVNIHNFDPDYLHVMISHHVTVMANVQLSGNRHLKLFEYTLNNVNEKIDHALIPIWSRHINMTDQPELALRYFQMIRDVFYARLTTDKLNYEFLHGIAAEAKIMTEEMRHIESFSSYSTLMELNHPRMEISA